MNEKQPSPGHIGPGRIGRETTLRAAIRGLAISRMLGVACEVGLPDAFGGQDSIGVADLADRLGCHRGTLHRLVRTLAALGVFAIDAQGTVTHTGASRGLRGDAASPQHLAARFWTLPAVWAAWGKLGEAVRTGQAAFPFANNGQTFFGHLGETPADQSLFRSFMQSGFADRHEAVAAALALAEAETVVDVGGGSGALLRAILTRHPDAHGVLYDRPEVVAGAPAVLNTPELRNRCAVAGGDFFRSVPTGGTTYLLCWILHDWPDEAAAAILRSVRAAMPARTRLVVVDRLLDAAPPASATPLTCLRTSTCWCCSAGASGPRRSSTPSWQRPASPRSRLSWSSPCSRSWRRMQTVRRRPPLKQPARLGGISPRAAG